MTQPKPKKPCHHCRTPFSPRGAAAAKSIVFCQAPECQQAKRIHRTGRDPWRVCSYCGKDFSARGAAVAAETPFCQAPECRKAYHSWRQREFLTRYREEHGESYHRRYYESYREKYRRDREAGMPSARERNPELFARHDALRRARLAEASIGDPFSLADVVERDGTTCSICGYDVDMELEHPDPDSPSLDHVMPLAAGGAHAMSNAALAHLVCNLRKGASIGF